MWSAYFFNPSFFVGDILQLSAEFMWKRAAGADSAPSTSVHPAGRGSPGPGASQGEGNRGRSLAVHLRPWEER